MASVAEQPLHRALGLTDDENDRIRGLLDRDPNEFELTVFSVLWSEHCGYKHSALLLHRFPTEGPGVLQGPGENAGVVDIGSGEAVAFKVESHNHPSAVEPFQGAATGVGGILRDVIAMGARPVALLDGLRFGTPGWDFSRAVGGIGHYGNCVGVPTVGGDTFFDAAYETNPLVNAMCVGIVSAERLTRARASGPGNLIVLYGATTGRDGIGGASVLASHELSDEDDDKRPSVQIGDPFTGKKLIEASLELAERGLVQSLQDLGAAGLASSLAEMAARGGAGVDVFLDRVPLREPDLEPVEIMTSESQERMVAVLAADRVEEVAAVCAKWELACAAIGEVTDSGELRCFFGDEELAAIPVSFLTEETPRYRVRARPRPLEEPIRHRPVEADRAELLDLLASPNVRSRASIYERYDY
ncbi:MAG: phosphoribosylformylglycinamidine synthase subunit PurL, partial [Actinomycetota bacterium]|nr:phosphoribosylformylglycinamidine synthase subunit PurL [Actinomycetota bacterium]